MSEIILRINYEKKSDKFLLKNSNRLTKDEIKLLVIKAVRKLAGKDENIDIAKIIVTIANLDFRGSVYKYSA
jgi:hypothetical protein